MPDHPTPRAGKTLLLVNPASGHGRAGRMAPRITSYLRSQQVRVDTIETSSAEDLERRAASAAAEGYSHVAALGGDGAFHNALNGAFGTRVVLAFLPAGNGNDIALGLGVSIDAVAAAAEFVRAAPRPIDVVRAQCAGGQARVFIGVGGVGLDSEAAQLVHGHYKELPGVVRYVAAAFRALAQYQPLEVKLTFNEQQWTGRALLAATANAPSYGAGLKIAAAAKMNDGFLDVTVVGEMSWTRVADAFLPLLRTGDLRWPEIRRFRAHRVRLETSRAMIFHADGELLGEAPVDLEVLPGAVAIAGADRA